MSDENTEQDFEEEATASEDAFDNGPTRLESLKQKANAMGLKHSPNIGEETLAQKIKEEEAKFSKDPLEQEAVQTKTLAPKAKTSDPRVPRKGETPSLEKMLLMDTDDVLEYPPHLRTRIIRAVQRHRGLKLIRCQIYNNNPAKNDLKGEILTISNKYIGVVRKFIPFGEDTEKGYHVPQILYDMLKRRKYQRVTTVKNPDGTERVVQSMTPEYTINVLPPLTQAELNELAIRQAAAERVGLV